MTSRSCVCGEAFQPKRITAMSDQLKEFCSRRESHSVKLTDGTPIEGVLINRRFDPSCRIRFWL
jgi:hypothetical protein